jgi:hypothetical protein
MATLIKDNIVVWRNPLDTDTVVRRKTSGDGPFRVTNVYPMPKVHWWQIGEWVCDVVSTLDGTITLQCVPERDFDLA